MPDPPQVVVLALLLGRHPERGVFDALRISRSDNVSDDAALACGVHALQHQQHRAGVVGAPTVGVQHLLQLGESLVALGLQRDGVGLLAFEPGRGAGVDVRNLVALAVHQVVVRLVCPQVGQVDGLAHRLSNCGGKIGDGCGVSRNFSRDPPTSTMPHKAFHDSIVR